MSTTTAEDRQRDESHLLNLQRQQDEASVRINKLQKRLEAEKPIVFTRGAVTLSLIRHYDEETQSPSPIWTFTFKQNDAVDATQEEASAVIQDAFKHKDLKDLLDFNNQYNVIIEGTQVLSEPKIKGYLTKLRYEMCRDNRNASNTEWAFIWLTGAVASGVACTFLAKA